MFSVFGVFLVLYVLEHILGARSEEQHAAEVLSKVLEHGSLQQPLALPAGPTAIAPEGHPVQLPQTQTPQGPASPAAQPAQFPQALPSDLPPFPAGWKGGLPPGWEYSEPVQPAVSQRAQALVTQLWTQGEGTHTTEMTAGQWTTYNAEHVRGGKKGIVAYRPKKAA